MKPAEYCQRDRNLYTSALTPDYKTSVSRSPRFPLIALGNTVSEITGPRFRHSDIDPIDNDLLRNCARTGDPIGQCIIVHGRVPDENARPVPDTLVEIWRANAGGRYRHKKDSYRTPIEPNFGGCGRTLTDENGCYHYRTVKPGASPWRNSVNSWRPGHSHVSVFRAAFAQRMIARLDMNATVPLDAIADRFDIVLRGRRLTLFENRLEGN